MRIMTKLLFASVLMFISPMSYADINIVKTGDHYSLLVHRQILPADYHSFITAVETIKAKKTGSLGILLDSSGGHLLTALKIGREIRNINDVHTQVFIRKNDVCASACVFVLAGGKFRNIEGEVYIHRPFFDDDKATNAKQQKENYQKIEKLVTDYLHEMNISRNLYDDMIRIDSSDAKLLSYAELQGYGLGKIDIYESEAITAESARDLGITKSELHSRYRKLDEICSKEWELFNIAVEARIKDESIKETIAYKKIILDYENCYDEVMSGLK